MSDLPLRTRRVLENKNQARGFFGYTERVLRRMLTLGSAVSLVLCVGAAVLWVRSFWHSDVVKYCRPWRANSPDRCPERQMPSIGSV
jgi:hypothetical protein